MYLHFRPIRGGHIVTVNVRNELLVVCETEIGNKIIEPFRIPNGISIICEFDVDLVTAAFLTTFPDLNLKFTNAKITNGILFKRGTHNFHIQRERISCTKV